MPQYGPKITAELQQIISEIVRGWDTPAIYVSPSATFATERVIRATGRPFELHSADSTLLAAATGSYLAGQPFRLQLQPEARELLDYIAPEFEVEEPDPAAQLAAVMLGTKLAPNLGKDNTYYLRQREGYRRQWTALLKVTQAKIAAEELRLESFYLGGTAELLADAPADAAIISHAGLWRVDQKAEALLAGIFDWDRPDTSDLTKKTAIAEALERLMDRPYWLLLFNTEQHELAPFLRAKVQASNRGMPTFIYAGDPGQQRLVTPNQKIQPIMAPRLTVGMELTGDLGLTVVPAPQFDGLRASYLAANIRPGAAPFAVIVSVGGVIIGGYALDFDPQLSRLCADQLPQPGAYLLSDFAVGPTDYPRLSKLVVMAAISQEAKLLAERRDGQRRRSLVTTAFAKNPVSMKYRGLLNKLSGVEVEGTDLPGGKGWKLIYGGPLGGLTLSQTMHTWREKHGERKPASTASQPTLNTESNKSR